MDQRSAEQKGYTSCSPPISATKLDLWGVLGKGRFDCLLFTPLVREGSPALKVHSGQVQGHWTDETDSILLVTYTQSPGQDTSLHAGSYRGCPWVESEPEGAVGDTMRAGDKWVALPVEGCD